MSAGKMEMKSVGHPWLVRDFEVCMVQLDRKGISAGVLD